MSTRDDRNDDWPGGKVPPRDRIMEVLTAHQHVLLAALYLYYARGTPTQDAQLDELCRFVEAWLAHERAAREQEPERAQQSLWPDLDKLARHRAEHGDDGGDRRVTPAAAHNPNYTKHTESTIPPRVVHLGVPMTDRSVPAKKSAIVARDTLVSTRIG